MNLNVSNIKYQLQKLTAPQNKHEGKAENYSPEQTKTYPAAALHPLMFTSAVCFKGSVDKAGLDSKTYEIINKTLDKCHYGKKNLFDPQTEYSFETDDKNLYFRGFYPKDKLEEGYNGICQELAFKVKKRFR